MERGDGLSSPAIAQVLLAREVGRFMKKASEYRAHARECGLLAKKMESAEQRDQLLLMAEHWERLANDRSALILRRPELAGEGEHVEEASARAGSGQVGST